ncbi:MAG: hypothetical protein IJ447_06865, partial [Clostridia bacterium]|nr:hypothetical protein [Clostridia bacterium]
RPMVAPTFSTIIRAFKNSVADPQLLQSKNFILAKPIFHLRKQISPDPLVGFHCKVKDFARRTVL